MSNNADLHTATFLHLEQHHPCPLILFVLLGVLAILPLGAYAGVVNLAWDESSDRRVAVYQVHFGTRSGQYPERVESANSAATLEGLTPGEEYFFVVRACSAGGAMCSGFSEEIAGTIPSPAPSAAFTMSQTSGTVGMNVVFTDTSSGNVTGHYWNFGDGSTETGASVVTHQYNAPGTYTVTLLAIGPNGSDTIVRTNAVTVSEVEVADESTEVNHSVTDANGSTENSPAQLGDSVFELGEFTLNHEWRRVNFTRTYEDPIVIVKPLQGGGVDPATVKIKDIDRNGFSVRIQEWFYLDGRHITELATYIAMERGVHELPDGRLVEAGSVKSDAMSEFDSHQFAASFESVPVVLAALNTTNGADPAVIRLWVNDTKAFEFKMQEEEIRSWYHVAEIIGYIAIEPGSGFIDGRPYEVQRTEKVVTHNLHDITFDSEFSDNPIFLADIQTFYGTDTANLRFENMTADGVSIWVDEEQSLDKEVHHVPEIVGYIAFDY